MEELSASIESASEKLANLDSILAGIPQDERSKIADALQRQVAAYEQQRNVLAAITPEVMAANAAEADRAALLAKSAAEAAKLAAQVEKALEARDASAEQRVLAGLSPEDAQDRVLNQIGAESADGVLSEMESLRAMGNDATDEQKARLMQLIEAEKTLLEIKGRQTAEDEKRAEHAAKLSELMGDLALDADKALAMATGDEEKVREIESQKAANELQRRLESEGMDPAAAAELAQKQAELQRLSGELQNAERLQPQQGDAQRSIGLGGSAGLGPSIDVQKEIAKKQEAANSLLTEIKDLVKNRQVVRVAEVFD